MDEDEIQYQITLKGVYEQAEVILSTSDMSAGDLVLLMYRAMIALGFHPGSVVSGTEDALQEFRGVFGVKDWREKVQ